MKSQHSDIATGLSTKKHINSRSPASGRDQSSAPAPHPIVLGIHYGGNKSKIARNEKRKVVWQILKHFNTLKQFTKHKPLISE